MQIIKKETDYAVRALRYIASKKKEYISAAEISKNEKIPYQFLRKILRSLCKEDLIESKEGISGGVKLKVKANNILLTDLIKIFKGRIKLSSCMFHKELCGYHLNCILRKKINRIEGLVFKELNSITLSNLM